MYKKLIYTAIIALTVNHVYCKKPNNKKLSDANESTPQPSVLTYSNFGFNDVGSYDGFVPTSPDYASFLNGNKQESSTRLYAPAFPSSLDSTGIEGNYGSSASGQPQQNPEEELQASMSKYQPISINFFTSPSFESNNDPYANVEGTNSPTYGTKLGSKIRNKPSIDFQTSNTNKSSEGSLNINTDAYRTQDSYRQSETKPLFNEFNNENYPSFYKFTTTTVVPLDYDHYLKSPVTASAIKFPKVIDFTNINFNSANNNHNEFLNTGYSGDQINLYDQVSNNGNPTQTDKEINKYNKQPTQWKQNTRLKEEEVKSEKDALKFNFAANQEFSQNYFNNKNKLKAKYAFNSDKIKKPWGYSSKDDDYKKPKPSIRYEYVTNHSGTSSKYDNYKRPFNSSVDEIAPASSNIDFYKYQSPDVDFGSSNFASIKSPFISEHNDFVASYEEKIKNLDDYENNYKNSFTTLPTISTHWGNLFKPTEFNSYKSHIRKPSHQDEIDEIVHIPKRPSYNKFASPYESNSFNDWYRPHTTLKHEWQKDNNRYKSEEDLLGLRNHDQSRPSYQSYKPTNYDDSREDYDYKKLVDKWKQSYLKTKHKDTFREYESYASEAKPIHVPVPKPYPIEIPHPVIVPVPQPYPVHVPVPKPVAVPVIRELTVPIEKPVPYPVYKKVPYPVEKPVPVPVEKQVHVPKAKPYPVTVPQVRPLFHHTRAHDDRVPEFEDDDDDYQPRPESSKRIPNVKRPRKTQPKRPSRMTYTDTYNRDKRRPAARRPSRDRPRPRRPHRHDDYDEYEPSEYVHCKRTGKC